MIIDELKYVPRIVPNYIVFEGIDGCGKTTKSKIAKAFFEKLGYNVLLTKEPGSPHHPSCVYLRSKLLDPNLSKTVNQELALMLLDRKIHMTQVVLPFVKGEKPQDYNSANLKKVHDFHISLAKKVIENPENNIEDLLGEIKTDSLSLNALNHNNILISDRDGTSSVSYQGYGGNKNMGGDKIRIDVHKIKYFNNVATRGNIPGFKIIFDIAPSMVLDRVTNANYFELKTKSDPTYFVRVSIGYTEQMLNKHHYENIEFLNAEDSLFNVAQDTIMRLINYGIDNLPDFRQRMRNFEINTWLNQEVQKYLN